MDHSKSLKIVIVEDDPIVALDLCTYLSDEGYEVVDTISDFDQALTGAKTIDADVFTLDYNLGRQNSAPIAAALNGREIPFVVISAQIGNLRNNEEFENCKMIGKPYRHASISTAILACMD